MQLKFNLCDADQTNKKHAKALDDANNKYRSLQSENWTLATLNLEYAMKDSPTPTTPLLTLTAPGSVADSGLGEEIVATQESPQSDGKLSVSVTSEVCSKTGSAATKNGIFEVRSKRKRSEDGEDTASATKKVQGI